MTYVLAYDIGTTGVKACLFSVAERIGLLASAQEGYGLYLVEGGGAEQEQEEWWQSMCHTTRELFSKVDIKPEQIAGLSFCSQMQGLVLVDRDGNPVRRAMSYMDQRAGAELKKGLAHGPQIAGANVVKLLKCLKANGAVPSSVKDPVWKYKWVQSHEPDSFARTDKWLDVKEYLLLRTLMERPGRVFTRGQLLEAVWGVEHVGETRTVDVHIATLRTKLGECGRQIETVRGLGYRLEDSR